MASSEFISKNYIVTDEILKVSWDQSYIFRNMHNRNLIIIDCDLEIVKNNPSILSFINLSNYYANDYELALIPGCCLAFKNIIVDTVSNLNVFNLEFMGNFFNPYEETKFSTSEKIEFKELHVENQKNKFQLSQEKILEYFSEAILLNKNVQELNIADNRLNELLFGKIISCIKSNFSIRILNISNNNLGEKSAVYLKDILDNNFFIEKLYISNIHLKNEGIGILSENLMKNQTLKILDISSNFITYEGAVIINNFLINNFFLEKLNISENHITNEDGDNPLNTAIRYNMRLDEVDFSDCKFNNKSIIDLFENLKENLCLKKLILDKNKLNEDILIFLWDIINDYQYKFNSLSISMNNFSEKICDRVSEALKNNKNLNYLKLLNNNINENSMMKIFEALKHNSSLLEIDLRNNNSGKNIILGLSDLLKNGTKLKKISLKGNTKEDVFNEKDILIINEFNKLNNVEIDILDLML